MFGPKRTRSASRSKSRERKSKEDETSDIDTEVIMATRKIETNSDEGDSPTEPLNSSTTPTQSKNLVDLEDIGSEASSYKGGVILASEMEEHILALDNQYKERVRLLEGQLEKAEQYVQTRTSQLEQLTEDLTKKEEVLSKTRGQLETLQYSAMEMKGRIQQDYNIQQGTNSQILNKEDRIVKLCQELTNLKIQNKMLENSMLIKPLVTITPDIMRPNRPMDNGFGYVNSDQQYTPTNTTYSSLYNAQSMLAAQHNGILNSTPTTSHHPQLPSRMTTTTTQTYIPPLTSTAWTPIHPTPQLPSLIHPTQGTMDDYGTYRPHIQHTQIDFHSVPINLADARRRTKNVEADLPKFLPSNVVTWIFLARNWVRNYLDWDNSVRGSLLKKEVLAAILIKTCPQLTTIITGIANSSEDVDKFLKNLSNHYDNKSNLILASRSFEESTQILQSEINQADYTVYYDRLVEASRQHFSYLGEVEILRKVLTRFCDEVKPNFVAEDVFKLLAGNDSIMKFGTLTQMEQLARFMITTANVSAASRNRGPQKQQKPITPITASGRINTAVFSTQQTMTKHTTTPAAARLAPPIQGQTNFQPIQTHTPLAQRDEQSRREYLRNYRWDKPLCPQGRKRQPCGPDRFKECCKEYRHLWTPKEKELLEAGHEVSGEPATFEEHFLDRQEQ